MIADNDMIMLEGCLEILGIVCAFLVVMIAVEIVRRGK